MGHGTATSIFEARENPLVIDLDRILGVIRETNEKRGMTTREIAEVMGVSYEVALEKVKAACKAGLLKPARWSDDNHWSGRKTSYITYVEVQ